MTDRQMHSNVNNEHVRNDFAKYRTEIRQLAHQKVFVGLYLQQK